MTENGTDLIVRFVRLKHAPNTALRKMTEGSAGIDLCAAVDKDVDLPSGKHLLVPTGYIFEIPSGFEAQVRPRSGLAAQHGVSVLNAPGTVDSDYRGEVKVLLINHGEESFSIKRGDRIAQLVVQQVPVMRFEEGTELSETKRGEGGFGSTGTGAEQDAA